RAVSAGAVRADGSAADGSAGAAADAAVAAEPEAVVDAVGAAAEEPAAVVEVLEETAGWIPATFGRCGEVMGGGSGCG
ncbi:hypothetical protein, partial [Streptomyces smyrnaeus]|uniref:hypothetical protein n=1 Tax=Streptomyces smyrnaeus TaxID=1387713 RepID=UPI0036B073D2